MMLICLLTFSIIGGWLSRMCGGGPPSLPFGLDQWIYALPYFGVSYFAAKEIAAVTNYQGWLEIGLILAVSALGYVGAFIGKRTGHGGGMDAGTHSTEPNSGRKFEYFEFIIYPLHSKIGRYWYDIILITVTGLVVTVVPGILLSFISPFWGIFLALSGATKGLAYIIGWKVHPKGARRDWRWLNEPTSLAEFLTGFFGYLTCGLVLIKAL